MCIRDSGKDSFLNEIWLNIAETAITGYQAARNYWKVTKKRLKDEGNAVSYTDLSVMSQSSTNSAIVIWCIAAAVYERKHIQKRSLKDEA